MGRPKLIPDQVLLDLIKEYFDLECKGNIKKLKAAEITRYINRHGYPDYPATTLRRTPAAMEYIEHLKQTVRNDDFITTASYKTLDAARFVDTHRSRESLIRALTERDMYYKRIADSATQSFDRYNLLMSKYKSAEKTVRGLEEKVSGLEQEILELRKQNKELASGLKAYKSIVKTYVYPEIASELLAKEGSVRKTKQIILASALDSELITPDTAIRKEPAPRPETRSGSNIIQGLFSLD
ncbi:MAG: hypothetical protein MJ117_00455 [Lachnospiraceae bacterium]|nr:hypothetical protein [Lachnospiraceae bacterium]